MLSAKRRFTRADANLVAAAALSTPCAKSFMLAGMVRDCRVAPARALAAARVRLEPPLDKGRREG